MKKKEFEFTITYFKTSGKFYIRVKYIFECVIYPIAPEEPAMLDIVGELNHIRSSGQGSLPGMNGSNWDGYILIDCEQGVPVLLFPPPPQDEVCF